MHKDKGSVFEQQLADFRRAHICPWYRFLLPVRQHSVVECCDNACHAVRQAGFADRQHAAASGYCQAVMQCLILCKCCSAQPCRVLLRQLYSMCAAEADYHDRS